MAAHGGSVEDSNAFDHGSLMPQERGSLNAVASGPLKRGWGQALDLPISPQCKKGGCVVVEVCSIRPVLGQRPWGPEVECDANLCTLPAFSRTRAVLVYDEVGCGLPVKRRRGPSDSSRGGKRRRLAFGTHVTIYFANHEH